MVTVAENHNCIINDWVYWDFQCYSIEKQDEIN